MCFILQSDGCVYLVLAALCEGGGENVCLETDFRVLLFYQARSAEHFIFVIKGRSWGNLCFVVI